MTQSIKEYFFSFLKLILVISLSCVFFIILYFLFKETGWLGKFNNVQELKQLILNCGFLSYAVFVIVQFLQVIILPIPAFLVTIVGVILFGPFISFLLSLLAILLGSIVAYFLGKIIGIKLLIWAIGQQKTNLLQEKLKKGKYVYFLMMLFPFFPDDILCMLAGVINMDFKFFLYTNLITRTIGIFSLCFIGGGGIMKIFF